MEHVAHWDEAPTRRREAGHIGATWTDLGSAAGSVRVGLQRIAVDPGRWSTPAHSEGAEEEIFFVLGGSGLSWQDGEVYEVGPGDCLVHLAQEEAHTLQGGPDGLDVLAFGQRVSHGNTILPRAGVGWAWPGFLEAIPISETEHPFLREAAAGEPGEAVVEEDDVGRRARTRLERARTVPDRSDDAHVRRDVDQELERLPEDVVVLDEENADRLG